MKFTSNALLLLTTASLVVPATTSSSSVASQATSTATFTAIRGGATIAAASKTAASVGDERNLSGVQQGNGGTTTSTAVSYQDPTTYENERLSVNVPPPLFRYIPFNELDPTTQGIAIHFGYEERSWNLLGSTSMEALSYEHLIKEKNDDYLLAALGFINDHGDGNTSSTGGGGGGVARGVGQQQWDCYINHYLDSTWDELASHDVQRHYVTLGWTEDMWIDDDGDEVLEPPESESKYYIDLSGEQQHALNELCYFPQVWDDIPLPFWNKLKTNGSSSVTSTHHSNNRDAPPQVIVEEEVVVEEEDDGTTVIEAIEERPDELDVEDYEELYEDNANNEEDFKDTLTFGPQEHNTRNIQLPYIRYVLWNELPSNVKHIATEVLDYDERTWNTPGSNEMEHLDYDNVIKSITKYSHPAAPGGITLNPKQALQTIGFTSWSQWDCYMNHYTHYTWSELQEYDIQQYYITLGYAQSTWDIEYTGKEGMPLHQDTSVTGKYWPDLTTEQRQAAYELCYFRETWDEVTMNLWSTTVKLETEESESATTQGDGDEYYDEDYDDDSGSSSSSRYSNASSSMMSKQDLDNGDIAFLTMVIIASIILICGLCSLFVSCLGCCGNNGSNSSNSCFNAKELELEASKFGMRPYSDTPSTSGRRGGYGYDTNIPMDELEAQVTFSSSDGRGGGTSLSSSIGVMS